MAVQSNVYLLILVAGTVFTGCLNSLFTKYQDNQCVKNCDNPDLTTHKNFEQPALQTLQMFIGEMGCFIVYYLIFKTNFFQKEQEYTAIGGTPKITFRESFKLAVPAICDLLGTTLLNIGLMYTPVSVYQMMRGSIVLFVAFLSVIFLKRKITKLEWIELIIITLGIAIVGLAGSQGQSGPVERESLVVVGIFLIVIAEFSQAFQFVVEEHIFSKQPIIPLQLVYYEGFYGSVILMIALFILNFIIGSTSSPEDFYNSPFNLSESFKEMFSSQAVLLSSIAIMISIASFNYFGISLTFHLSATARSTIDSCRTLLVWFFALLLGWETFSFLQMSGFILLVFGTLCFNQALKPEEWSWIPSSLKSPPHPALIDESDEPLERS